MARGRNGISDSLTFSPDGWQLHVAGDDPAVAGWAATMTALSNGAIGVRGEIEERAAATTFLAHAYEQAPIHYHERLHGFAATTDSRVPVAEPLGLEIRIDGVAIDLSDAVANTCRTLNLKTGLLSRRTEWTFAGGRRLVVWAERLVPLDGTTLLVRRLRAEMAGALVSLHPRLAPAPRQMGQSDDPRIGVALGTAGFATEQAGDDLVVERLVGSGIGVAAAQRCRDEDGWLLVATAYAVGRETSEDLARTAGMGADAAAHAGFAVAADRQRRTLADFWQAADLAVHGGERPLTATLRTNLFHLFASAGRDGWSSAAAKGLTGEGYEGHYFWDAEAFMLPVLAMVAPQTARAMLLYRFRTLDAAIANARTLDHRRGALYAWRTIEGRECSAHYPSGSAQYHINAAIAFAIELYVDATGDEQFLIECGLRMLVETARLWLALGDWQDGRFHLRGVTGPDEYTALIDDNWYTNRMAQKHLRYAVAAARRVAAVAPAAWAELGVDDAELDAFVQAADAMHLPYDVAHSLYAQDASFLAKPQWDMAGTAKERPLLLHYHPLTLYRHQVAKQADLVLGMVLGGEDVSRERKRRVFDHYEPITTHDSTLSASTFAILANEVGYEAEAVRFFADTAFVDIDDRHGNADHGLHMAALAGSWLALVWGFAGFRPNGSRLGFRPTLPAAWRGYRFGLVWRGTRVRVEIMGDEITYRAEAGPDIAIGHHDQQLRLAAGEAWTGPLGA